MELYLLYSHYLRRGGPVEGLLGGWFCALQLRALDAGLANVTEYVSIKK